MDHYLEREMLFDGSSVQRSCKYQRHTSCNWSKRISKNPKKWGEREREINETRCDKLPAEHNEVGPSVTRMMVTIAVSLTKTFIAFVIANEAKPRSSTRSSARWKNCSETCSCDKVRPKEERRCFRRKKLQRRVTGKIPPLRSLHDDKAFPEEFFFSSSSSSINEKKKWQPC